MTLLYFAWVRQKIGCGEETLSLPPQVKTVGQLVAHLTGRGAGYSEAFADLARIRVAVNQQHTGYDALLGEQDEVAFFPPVTGG